MATITNVLLTDDLDGQPADGTLRFALDGTDYEIDVHNANAEAIRAAFKRWIEAGRKVPGQRQRKANGGARKTGAASRIPAATFQPPIAATSPSGDLTREQRDMVRAWCRTQGIPVAERGRIARETVDRWWGATDGGRHG